MFQLNEPRAKFSFGGTGNFQDVVLAEDSQTIRGRGLSTELSCRTALAATLNHIVFTGQKNLDCLGFHLVRLPLLFYRQ